MKTWEWSIRTSSALNLFNDGKKKGKGNNHSSGSRYRMEASELSQGPGPRAPSQSREKPPLQRGVGPQFPARQRAAPLSQDWDAEAED